MNLSWPTLRSPTTRDASGQFGCLRAAVMTLGRRNGGFGWVGVRAFGGAGDGGDEIGVLLSVHRVDIREGQFGNGGRVEFLTYSGGFGHAINVVLDAGSGAGDPGKFHRVRWPAVQQQARRSGDAAGDEE